MSFRLLLGVWRQHAVPPVYSLAASEIFSCAGIEAWTKRRAIAVTVSGELCPGQLDASLLGRGAADPAQRGRERRCWQPLRHPMASAGNVVFQLFDNELLLADGFLDHVADGDNARQLVAAHSSAFRGGRLEAISGSNDAFVAALGGWIRSAKARRR